ncbi:winged helix-turn-helix domain-containing protein [Arthrobacter sp. RCC_34]|uniref:winged helix-turn-helix domain-containing protein n=1 Tax=Arthrobacter sp. RCC_34 TaxID=3239230 RepID=UPI003525133E
MPRVYTPPIRPSDEAESAMRVFQAGTLRSAIIRDMSQHPEGSTTQEIAERLNVTLQQVYRHVRQLGEDEIVIELGRGVGHRRGPVYGVDQEALEAKNAAYLRHLQGK